SEQPSLALRAGVLVVGDKPRGERGLGMESHVSSSLNHPLRPIPTLGLLCGSHEADAVAFSGPRRHGNRSENCCAAYCRLFAAIFRAAAQHGFYLIGRPSALNTGCLSLVMAFGFLLKLHAKTGA